MFQKEVKNKKNMGKWVIVLMKVMVIILEERIVR